MLKFISIVAFLWTLTLFGCSDDKIEKCDVLPLLQTKVSLAKKSSEMIKLELCNIDNFKWDKVIVVVPYTTAKMIRIYNLENSTYVRYAISRN